MNLWCLNHLEDETIDSYVKSIRPGYGLQPKFIKDIVGKISIKEIKAGTPVKKEHL